MSALARAHSTWLRLHLERSSPGHQAAAAHRHQRTRQERDGAAAAAVLDVATTWLSARVRPPELAADLAADVVADALERYGPAALAEAETRAVIAWARVRLRRHRRAMARAARLPSPELVDPGPLAQLSARSTLRAMQAEHPAELAAVLEELDRDGPRSSTERTRLHRLRSLLR